MITKINKEGTILTAGFGFISRELDRVIKESNLTIREVSVNKGGKHTALKRVLRLLQKLEIGLGDKVFLKNEEYLNKCISKVNAQFKKNGNELIYVSGVMGITLLELYKENWKGKRLGRGLINWVELNEISLEIEESNKSQIENIIKSQDLADNLYREILK